MQTNITNIYKPKNPTVKNALKRSRLLQIAAAVLVLAHTIPSANTTPVVEPINQEFILTGYYSPLEGQCCYVKGGVKADRILNGEGHTAADGTAVYAGLIAAPPSYPFGTVVELPGLGVFKVHDRGGAIQEWDNGKHRLDLWVGFGEDGLARALQLGLKEIKGTIYPPGSDQPEVTFDFDAIAAPQYQLERFKINNSLLEVTPTKGDSGLSVSMLQERLHTLGYLAKSPTGFFGEETIQALQQFITDFRIDQPADTLTTKTAAHLLAAVVRKNAPLPLTEFINEQSSPQEVIDAQRLSTR
jgi:3D (Asp-Asp-Asp) domain-containing protein